MGSHEWNKGGWCPCVGDYQLLEVVGERRGVRGLSLSAEWALSASLTHVSVLSS